METIGKSAMRGNKLLFEVGYCRGSYRRVEFAERRYKTANEAKFSEDILGNDVKRFLAPLGQSVKETREFSWKCPLNGVNFITIQNVNGATTARSMS